MNFSPVVDFFGKGGTMAAIFLNVKHWLFSEEGSITFAVVISILVSIYWAMKIYDQYLITKKRKKDERKN